MVQKKISKKNISYKIFLIKYLIKYRVNCYFYSKIGACKHGDHCNRIHNKPNISQTIMFRHLYQNPPAAISFAEGEKVSDEDLKEALKHFEQFYEEIFLELSNFGELKDLSVCDNMCDHLIGNVYAKFYDEASASKAFNELEGKYYHSNLVDEEYCPIINVKDCKCRKYEDGLCQRGAFCNFLHIKEVNKSLVKSLKDEMYEIHPEYKKNRMNNDFNKKKKQRKHEHTSSESSLDRYDNFTRKRIIQRWNDDYKAEKKIEDRRKRLAKNKNKIEEKLRKKKYHEDYKEKEDKKEKKEKKDKKEKKEKKEKNEKSEKKNEKKYDSDDEETISAGNV